MACGEAAGAWVFTIQTRTTTTCASAIEITNESAKGEHTLLLSSMETARMAGANMDLRRIVVERIVQPDASVMSI